MAAAWALLLALLLWRLLLLLLAALLLAPRLLLGVHLAAGLGRDAVCLGQSAVCLGQSVGGLGLEPDDDGVKRAEKIEAALGSDGAGAAGEAL